MEHLSPRAAEWWAYFQGTSYYHPPFDDDVAIELYLRGHYDCAWRAAVTHGRVEVLLLNASDARVTREELLEELWHG